MSCKYIKPSELKNYLILFDRDTLMVGGVDGGTSPSFIPSTSPETVQANSVEYSEEETFDGRYAFKRTVTARFNGHVQFDNTDYILAIETTNGDVFALNVDLKYEVKSEFTLNSEGAKTTLTFEIQSNMPLFADSSGTNTYAPSTCQSYSEKVKPESVRIKTHNTSFIDDYGQLITTDGDGFIELSDATGIELTENVDEDGEVNRTLALKLPFDKYSNSTLWGILELPENKWNAIVQDSSGIEYYLGFHQFGMECSYEVDENSFNVTFRETCFVPMSIGNYSGTTSTYTFWRYSHEFERCVGNGLAVSMLQAEIDIAGNETGYYKCLSDYLDYFVHLGYNIVDTYDSAPLIKSDACDEQSCAIQTDRRVLEFDEYTDTIEMTVQTTCPWTLAGIPSWLEVNPEYGTGTTDIEFVCTSTASTRTTIYLATDGNPLSIDVVNDMGQQFATSYQVNAKAQTLFVQMKDSFTVLSSTAPYSTTTDGIQYSIPENTTTSARTFTSSVSYKGQSVTIEIEQAGRYEKWVNTTGFICESGDTYSRQELLISYDNLNWVSGGIYRPYGLVAEGQDLCAGYMERWQDVGGFLCYNEKQYHSETLQVSTDGGQTWSDTSEIRIGQINNITAIQHSARCSNLDYEWRLTNKTVCKQ